MRRNWLTFAAASAVVLLAGGTAYAIGHHTPPEPAHTTPAATVTIVGATATIYGANATETVVGEPMPLSDLTDTVVVVIEATATPGSCEILVNGMRPPGGYASTSAGQQAVCVWNRLR